MQSQDASLNADQPGNGQSEPELTYKQLSEQLLAAIQSSTSSLSGKIDEVRVDVSLLGHDLQNLWDWVKETEARISQLEDDAVSFHGRLVSLDKAANMWSQRADDLENCLWGNNLWILGLPERSEGKNTCSFIETWIKKDLAWEGLRYLIRGDERSFGAYG